MTRLNYPHDIIKFSAVPLISRYDEFAELYLKQLSLRDISLRSGIPLSTIRSVLVAGGMVMRSNKKVQELATKRANRSFTGAIPYGYCLVNGKLIQDPKEQSIIQIILELWRQGASYNAIKNNLNDQNIPSKLRRQWNDKTVKAIIERNQK